MDDNKTSQVIDAKRSEFVFLYDTRMANPNGDPDENRPRIDPYSERNLVTEYRLKRTIRDFLIKKGELIFIREDLNENGTRKVIEEIAEPYITTTSNKGKTVKIVDKDKLINEHIDVRLFGLMFLVEDIPFKKIGPVQFSIGQSLNKVQDIVIRNTRIVPTRKEVKSGTFGEKTILKYSLILFHGFLNQFAAEELKLTEDDVNKMMMAMWHGTNNLSTSSKFGQISRFLLRVVYKDSLGYIGDLDIGIRLANTDDTKNIEDISKADIDIRNLLLVLNANLQSIEGIEFACHDNLIAITSSEGQNMKKNKLKDALLEWSNGKEITCKDLLAR